MGAANLDDGIYASASDNDRRKKFLKDRYRVIMLHGFHEFHYMRLLKAKNRLAWAMELMRMSHAFLLDEKLISHTQAIQTNKTGNISFGI